MASDDQFFEEEDDVAQGRQASARTRPDGRGSAPRGQVSCGQAPREHPDAPAPAKPGACKPPSFAMVVAIAVVAVILGYALGYFMCLSTTSNKLTSEMSRYTTDVSYHDGEAAGSGASDASSAASGVNDELGLPTGHPDLSSLINDDGSINEANFAAYKAQLAAASSAQQE